MGSLELLWVPPEPLRRSRAPYGLLWPLKGFPEETLGAPGALWPLWGALGGAL